MLVTVIFEKGLLPQNTELVPCFVVVNIAKSSKSLVTLIYKMRKVQPIQLTGRFDLFLDSR